MLKKVLVVDDDQDIVELVRYHLSREGYEVSSFADGVLAMEYAFKVKPDLFILDIMLPGQDGIDCCRQIKSDQNLSSVPVIMLTAKGEESDVLVGLQMGADDYITKPFSPKILVARVKALLRRINDSRIEGSREGNRIFQHLMIDLLKHKVILNHKEIGLTAIEFDILEFLSRTPGRVYTREQILDNVWEEGKGIIDRAVDVHIRGLRKKLDDPQEFIETVRGVGYRFKEFE